MKNYVVVTGATGGIGSAVVRRLLQEPEVDYVLGACRSRAKWNALFQEECGRPEGRLVRVSTEPEAFRRETEAFFGQEMQGAGRPEEARLQLVLTAFSLQPADRILSIAQQDLQANLQANLEEPVSRIQSALRLCRRYGMDCRIVYLGSGAAHRPLNGWSLYCAGKSFMNLFLRTLAQEEGIPIVSFDPGVVDTPMQEQIRGIPAEVFGQVQTFREYHTQHKLHSVQEVADYLARRYILTWQAEEFEERYRRTEPSC